MLHGVTADREYLVLKLSRLCEHTGKSGVGIGVIERQYPYLGGDKDAELEAGGFRV